MKMRAAMMGILVGCALNTVGCLTVLGGFSGDQELEVYSEPPGAWVRIDPGGEVERTPAVFRLNRRRLYSVEVELEGFATETRLVGSVTPPTRIIISLLFGGLTGLAVDSLSGATSVLTPSYLELELEPLQGVPEPQPRLTPKPEEEPESID